MKQRYYLIVGIAIVLAIVAIVFTSFPTQKYTERLEPDIAPAPYADVEATVISLFLDDIHSDCEAPEVCPMDRVTIRIDKVVNKSSYELPPSFYSTYFSDISACERVKNFLEQEKSPYIESISKCEKSAVWIGPETSQGRSEIRYLFYGVFSPEITRKDIEELQKDLQDRFGSKLSISSFVMEDDVLEFNLKYSARPAKLREDLMPSCPVGWVFKNRSCVQEGCQAPACPASAPQYGKRPAEIEGNYIIYHLPQRTDKIIEKTLPGLRENSKIKIRIWLVPNFEIGEYELI
ncbi:MAG: hypothetical protein QXQ40_01320 [Candidatus Aenigmatarchaeota archaeon]